MDIKSMKVHDDPRIMIFEIPDLIWGEIKSWVRESKKIKNHPLAELKAHENVGYLDFGTGEKNNSYQCSIPPHLIDQSYWLPWVLRLCAEHWGVEKNNHHRRFKLRKWEGHFDGYDLWTNFSYKGDKNPQHNHAGWLSGVIYYQNHEHPTIFPNQNMGYEGKNKTMILFPSFVEHLVEEQTVNKERITIAFNISLSQ
jgi:hypothetical protein